MEATAISTASDPVGAYGVATFLAILSRGRVAAFHIVRGHANASAQAETGVAMYVRRKMTALSAL
jgi:hypothetical protein